MSPPRQSSKETGGTGTETLRMATVYPCIGYKELEGVGKSEISPDCSSCPNRGQWKLCRDIPKQEYVLTQATRSGPDGFQDSNILPRGDKSQLEGNLTLVG